MADRTGQQLGNYRILRLIGKGGFADVYLGEHIYYHRCSELYSHRLNSSSSSTCRLPQNSQSHKTSVIQSTPLTQHWPPSLMEINSPSPVL